MSMHRWWLAATLLIAAPALSAPPDLMKIVSDFERVSKLPDHYTIVIWAPPEFFLKAAGLKIPPAGTQQPASITHQMVMVVDLHGNPATAATTFTDSEAIRRTLTLEDGSGGILHPLAQDALPPDALMELRVITSTLKNSLGDLGEHMAILAFPLSDERGQRFADPAREGSLSVHLGDATVRYELPLESVLAPMLDPKTHASFPGTYRFNPFTGDRLVPAPPDP